MGMPIVGVLQLIMGTLGWIMDVLETIMGVLETIMGVLETIMGVLETIMGVPELIVGVLELIMDTLVLIMGMPPAQSSRLCGLWRVWPAAIRYIGADHGRAETGHAGTRRQPLTPLELDMTRRWLLRIVPTAANKQWGHGSQPPRARWAWCSNQVGCPFKQSAGSARWRVGSHATQQHDRVLHLLQHCATLPHSNLGQPGGQLYPVRQWTRLRDMTPWYHDTMTP